MVNSFNGYPVWDVPASAGIAGSGIPFNTSLVGYLFPDQNSLTTAAGEIIPSGGWDGLYTNPLGTEYIAGGGYNGTSPSPTSLGLDRVVGGENPNTYYTLNRYGYGSDAGLTKVTFADGTTKTVGIIQNVDPVTGLVTITNGDIPGLSFMFLQVYERDITTGNIIGSPRLLASFQPKSNLGDDDPGVNALNDLIAAHGAITAFDPPYQVGGSSVHLGYKPWGVAALLPCFTAGTMILTPAGEIAVETLEAGDEVVTKNHGVQKLIWAGKTTVNLQGRSDDCPVVFEAGSVLGNEKRISVSPNHRMLVSKALAEVLFGEADVLVPAKFFVDGNKVHFDTEAQTVEYVHIMCENHSIVFGNGVESETFYVGNISINGFGHETRNELLKFFPELVDGTPKMEAAHPILKEYEYQIMMAM